MDFYEMIKKVSNGEYCWRQIWGANSEHVGLYQLEAPSTGAEERLALYKSESDTWFPWTVSRSDLDASDWRMVEKKLAGSLRVAASPVPGKTTVQ